MVTAPSVTMLLLMLAIGARERIGVAGRGNDDALTIAVPPRPGARHIIDHLSALAAAFGVDIASADFSPSLTLTPEERRRALGIWESAVSNVGMAQRLLVNVSAGKAARYWPEDHFIELLGIVRHRAPAVQPLIIGGPEDRERVLAVSRAAGVATAQTATLRDALAFVGTADVVLSADTGLAHAAAAFRRPAIVLHRRGSAVLWGLYGAPGVALESEDASIRLISVEQVWQALEELLPSQTLVTPTEPPRPRERTQPPGTEAPTR
jgi:ADP-heptose:LPS heptosyltransferase